MTPIKEETQYSSPRRSFEFSSPAKTIISRQQMVSSRGKAPPEVNYSQMLPDEIGRSQGSSPLQQQHGFAAIEEGEEDEEQDQHGYEVEFEEEDTFFQDKHYSTSSIRPSDLDPQSPNVSSPQTTNAQSNKRRLENDVSKSKKAQAIETGPRSSKRQRLREVQENIGDAPGPTKYVEIATPSTDNGTRQNNGSNVLQGSYSPSHILISSSPCESLSGQPLSDELQSPAITDKSPEVPEVLFVNTKTRNSRLSDGSGSSEQGAAIGEMQLLVEGARHKRVKKKRKKRKRAKAKMI
ncbi:hypothetical protein DFP73DRAFT_553298 [Morchella snyderi]|nr:hypothetical protein DFP73DRAFT_553298 [Morchella snyderi]